MLYDLMAAIKQELAAAFVHPRFINDRNAEMAPVKIHIGQLPFKRESAEQNDFPYLLIQPAAGEDGDGSASATIRIHCGVFNDESGAAGEAGANDLANLIDRVRRALRLLRLVGVHDRYALTLPVKWRVGDPEHDHLQPLPMNEGVVITTWNLPAPCDVPAGEVQAALGLTL